MLYLNELQPGQIAQIAEISLPTKIATRLRDMGLIEGAEIERLRTAPFGDPVEYYTCGYRVALRKAETSQIQIELLEETAGANDRLLLGVE